MTRKYDYSNWDASERTPSTEEQMKGFDIQDYFDFSSQDDFLKIEEGFYD